ncbi:hypothetical protein [Kocuria palustris]|uniref:hypothetical protein n=1 Tax=Kocuria palustris TaxID=71999 RepID=UPI0028D5D2BB|nr:hypothetical protein [Kocuria palustris]
MSARSSETAVLPQEPTRTRATVVGGLPGTSAVEAFTVMRGELGAPHRSGLLPLPQRSDVADDLPRTVAVLTELWCDLQPHGWRLQRHDSKESRAARSLLASDLNVLADVIGAESDGDLEPVTTQLLGPTALAARLHLHGGERVLRDHGARRDLVDSLADGLGGHLSALRQSIGPRGIVVRLAEPELLRVLEGRIPTASGYQTLRAVPWSEVREGLERVVEAARAAGALSVELQLPEGLEPARALGVGADRIVVSAPGPSARDWEPLAEIQDSGTDLCLLLPHLVEGLSRPSSTSREVEAIVRPISEVGMPLKELSRLMVAVGPGLEELAPDRLQSVLGRVADIARGLEDTAREA